MISPLDEYHQNHLWHETLLKGSQESMSAFNLDEFTL